jgi:uncharacterized membrane protein
MTGYIALKYFHVLIAIVALGTSAGLGILLEFYGSHPAHGAYMLRAIRTLTAAVVAPGYALMAATGVWMTHLSWSFTLRWIAAALALWVAGAVFLGLTLGALTRQIRLAEAGETGTSSYKRIALLARALGGGVGLVVVSILYLMVTKPALA